MNLERSERNLYRGLHRYSELLIFVVFSFVPLLTTNIQTISKFHFGLLLKTANFRVIFHLIMIATLAYLGFNIPLQHRSMSNSTYIGVQASLVPCYKSLTCLYQKYEFILTPSSVGQTECMKYFGILRGKRQNHIFLYSSKVL